MKPGVAPLPAVLFLAACVSAGVPSARDRGSTILTREEIAAVDVATLYEVVQRLRPRWLNVRADRSFTATTAIVVYQGQTNLGGIEVLEQLGPESVAALRYLDGPRASATLPGLGSEQVEGAIVIELRSD